ncbi:hypothetical protein DR62_07655 [Burkholderia thailandensis]|uniref:Uncharacterized protein n=1 Tax=Burkholderia thailandensis TaxID=57975 RepID=A0AAW9CQ28_BURTH|nr:hypothetical protein DR62_07655 [Burkholderia thailandensis]AOI55240.1 hypothetical protein WI24_26130 [Burkholderia thailandensis]AOJ54271.1 hypothetical protein AQ475_26295 [Burkholderia thailandensis]AOJ60170.1 hypothetical protein AQ477_27300 [Burkholderia thailandensis]AVR27570.1 hypothetical protein A8H32_21270 [Burkholderia thailandensis]
MRIGAWRAHVCGGRCDQATSAARLIPRDRPAPFDARRAVCGAQCGWHRDGAAGVLSALPACEGVAGAQVANRCVASA